MIELQEKMYVRASVSDARNTLPSLLSFTLRPIVSLPDLETEIVLRYDVAAVLTPDTACGGVPQAIVRWEPVDGGAFPRFLGEIRVEWDTFSKGTVLALAGACRIPERDMRTLSSRAVAQRISKATARALLTCVRDAIERVVM